MFWGEFDIEQLGESAFEMADINFWEWIVHDWRDSITGKALIDFYIEKKRVIPAEDRAVLNKMKESVLSLFEVQDVFPGKGMLMKDLLLGHEYDIKEKAASEQLRKWDIFAARVLEIDGQNVLAGSVYPFPMSKKKQLLDNINKVYRQVKKDEPGLDMRAHLKADGEMFNFYWCEMAATPISLPKITTMDGEPLEISRAYFDVEDEDTFLDALEGLPDFQEDEDAAEYHVLWLGKRDKNGAARIMGQVYFDENDRVVLETTSKVRLAKGKKILCKLSGATHRMDSFESIESRLKSEPQTNLGKEEDELSPEVVEMLHQKFMDDHYTKWMTEKIPALDGKTPKQAVRSTKGKEQVIALLKSIENTEEWNKQNGRPYYDITWMWEKLGLERE